jgi:hypothetical protein
MDQTEALRHDALTFEHHAIRRAEGSRRAIIRLSSSESETNGHACPACCIFRDVSSIKRHPGKKVARDIPPQD